MSSQLDDACNSVWLAVTAKHKQEQEEIARKQKQEADIAIALLNGLSNLSDPAETLMAKLDEDLRAYNQMQSAPDFPPIPQHPQPQYREN